MKFNGFKKEFPDDDKGYYSEGSCHEFAIAMNRLFGFKYMVVTSDDVPGGTDEDGETIPCVIHVFSYDPEKDVIHDVFGSCPAHDYRKHIEANFSCLSVDVTGMEIMLTDDELGYYIDSEKNYDKPLSSFQNNDIEQAINAILDHSNVEYEASDFDRAVQKEVDAQGLKKHLDIDLDCGPSNKKWELSSFSATPMYQGYGTKGINIICDVADKLGVKLTLSVASDGNEDMPDEDTLIAFYEKAGFNHYGDGEMVRTPAKPTLQLTM